VYIGEVGLVVSFLTFTSPEGASANRDGCCGNGLRIVAGQVNEMWAWDGKERRMLRFGNSVPEDQIPVLED
jgi:hypothetical protein